MTDDQNTGKNRLDKNDQPGSNPPVLSANGCAGYEIRVRNHLDSCWHEWFDGWLIINLANGEVLLSSSEVDQSGLHGALNKIRDLNLIVLSVTLRSTGSQQFNKE